MECKFANSLEHIGNIAGINRYIMECKFFCRTSQSDSSNELIDTLWNVNNTTDVTNNSPCGINRYIMECKYHGWKIF